MTERLVFDLDHRETFADVPARRIRGLAIPLGATASKAGRVWRFLKDSVKFGTRTPLLAYHDATRPVGLLTLGEWTDRGLEVEFAVSRTAAGNEALQLAHDGVVGLSVGIDVPEGGARLVGEELHVSTATAQEISLTPLPAFSGSRIDSVALSATPQEGIPVMPDCTDIPVAPVTFNLDPAALGAAIAAGLKPAAPPTVDGPVPQPVPNAATTQVAEEAPYRFDGRGGRFGFVADAIASTRGDGEATQRINAFIGTVGETFAVTRANAAALNPTQNRPDLYVPPLRYNRPLAGLISTGTISDATPFTLPKFGAATNLVNPHVEGVEPSLASMNVTSQTITPGVLSGKAEINRELIDQGGSPQADAIVWQEMLAASAEAAEARIADLLDGLTLTPHPITGANAVLVDDLKGILIGLQFKRGGNRYRSLALDGYLYTALINAKDADNRPLLPMINPTNADGSATSSFGAVQIGNAVGVPAWALGSDQSYLMVPESVWQWTSPPQRLTFEIQVKSVFIGFFQYSAEAVIRDDDVLRLTHS
ncbi:hypothetical protein ACFO1B_03820 [Dactylosporangium siamense]|uniref:Phage major capsid protein n=1 Tax=Dactylosporangium siamense TaxID=685454 RepID=A0A919PFI2_9ACTN|nr:hypothetical protein [Dactylosporangium siamense]GIG42989.1 hypothetical protein Dsi01nite_010300 [Dactylosporangium siamense]